MFSLPEIKFGNKSFGYVHFYSGHNLEGDYYGYVIMPPDSYERFLVDQAQKMHPEISDYGQVMFVDSGSSEPSNPIKDLMEKFYGVDHIHKLEIH
jgi:hypothetical protein